MADFIKRIQKTKRLIYIWKNCFIKHIRNIKIINFIEHSINLESNAKSVKDTLSKYIPQKREFVNKIFPKLENVEIIIRRNNLWDIKTKFLLKKKRSKLFRIIHNFILMNKWTIKLEYSMHHFEKVITILIKSKYRNHFCFNAVNEY